MPALIASELSSRKTKIMANKATILHDCDQKILPQ